MRQMTFVSRIFLRAALVWCQTALASTGTAASPADPSGTWLTEDGRARIRIERCASKPEQICGYVVWMKEPADASGQLLRDLNHPDAMKRSRPLLGHQMIMGLKLNQGGRFEGQIYNADNGRSYDISLWREAIDLKIRGCMLSFLCATQTWTQTMNALPGQLVGMTGDQNGPKADKEWMATAPAKQPMAIKPGK